MSEGCIYAHIRIGKGGCGGGEVVDVDCAVPAGGGDPGDGGLVVVGYFDDVFGVIAPLGDDFVEVVVVEDDLARHAGGDGDEVFCLGG